MNKISDLIRETKFAIRDRAVIIWMAVVFSLSALAVTFGLAEVKRQNAQIDSLIAADQQERLATSAKQDSWGSAAYYNFHFTYDRPSDFAFAAMGQRDVQPWKHRVRMLALEGQIYERDAGNPVVALIGRFDFAFLATYLLPLVLIMLLYGLRVNERISGRLNLLAATTGSESSLWITRTFVRVSAIILSLCIPLVVAGLVSGTAASTLLWAVLAVCVYAAFWATVCYFVAAWQKPGAMILMTLMGVWLSLAVIVPSAARVSIDAAVPVPSGADILMLQREIVNDAWDLPREATMEAFYERHPEWSDYEPVESSFEWQWYYAFQQVGDQRTEPLTLAYKRGRIERERLAGKLSVLSPPSLLERGLEALAKTDQKSALAYEDRVRQFHAELRGFYYPRFYQNAVFDQADLVNLPEFELAN